MTALDFSIPLSLGVVSSLHCTQMCGPIVLSYSLAGRGKPSSHLLYNLGRVTTYSLLGGAAGVFGGALGLLGRFAGIQQTASIVAGCFLLIAALLLSGAAPRQALVQVERLGVSRLFSRTIGRLITSPEPMSKLGLGLILGFLPCGLIYAALLKAAATANFADGALSMLAFGLGTAGALLAIGLFSSAISARLTRWSGALTTASVAAMGIFLLFRGLVTALPALGCHHGKF